MDHEAAKSDYFYKSASPAELSDQQCLSALSSGDMQALVELYGRYHKGIYNYVLRMINDVEASEDILQEVYVAVWQSAHRYGRRSSVKTWIYRIAHNQAVSWIRKQSKAELLVESTIDPPSDPEKTFELNWRAEEVRSAMSQLNPIHRATVELAFVHDLSYSEISEVLDCPVGTVKSRMSSAVKQMYGILRGSEGLISR